MAFFPCFFDVAEQRALLSASLRKLDSTESRLMKRRRKDYLSKTQQEKNSSFPDAYSGFLPDELYKFESGHFDGVIRHYREMHVSSWEDVASPQLLSALDRLKELYPSSGYDTQTHILHLASHGDIFPHVDNVEASGSWILGVSLGTTRLLRLVPVTGGTDEPSYEILLPPGSVYIQRNSIRYGYKHSILREGSGFTAGQRLSLMVRVSLEFT
ncbi:hypothetical protein K488DRAFT_68174 [Vararia minispora EC-137]|uniref:Uncharacterized protein n=1 Tax=Vararia minispora EC-137 TaxID=1314806 RepID=A0ACB8QVR5_9AGAM|nr:hypothetical protein K488DRAFT_68174 [Vararia minispora EC-137]